MLDNPYAKAAVGALLIGAGVVLILSATKLMDPPCVGCEDDAEEAIEAVAAASAEMAEPEDAA